MVVGSVGVRRNRNNEAIAAGGRYVPEMVVSTEQPRGSVDSRVSWARGATTTEVRTCSRARGDVVCPRVYVRVRGDVSRAPPPHKDTQPGYFRINPRGEFRSSVSRVVDRGDRKKHPHSRMISARSRSACMRAPTVFNYRPLAEYQYRIAVSVVLIRVLLVEFRFSEYRWRKWCVSGRRYLTGVGQRSRSTDGRVAR